MGIGWLTCIPAVLLPHSLCRSTTANAPANRQMPIASVVSGQCKKKRNTTNIIMSSKIFQTILDRKIEDFIHSFVIDAKSIFYKDEKLFHPGEYGKFRENTLKELLKFLIPTSFQIGEGFVITSNDNVSTQCDIVIYDNENLPLLNDGIYQFYTIESTLAIGEVKSDLNKTQFKDALKKLAKNKMLQDDRIKNIKRRRIQEKEREHLFTFLICRKFQFEGKVDFNEIYGDIPQKYWHNSILSIEDGIFHYNFPVLNRNYSALLFH